MGYGPSASEVIEALRAHNPTVVLAENHDHAVVTGNWSGFVDYAAKSIQWTRHQLSSRNMSYLQTLKPSARKRVLDTNIALSHGSPRDPLNEYIFPGIPSAVLKTLLRLSGAELLL